MGGLGNEVRSEAPSPCADVCAAEGEGLGMGVPGRSITRLCDFGSRSNPKIPHLTSQIATSPCKNDLPKPDSKQIGSEQALITGNSKNKARELMKPYIHATIIFAGFVMAAGTTAIVTAEYRLVSTKGQVLLSVLDEVRSNSSRAQAPMVAYRFEAPRDVNPFGDDVARQLQSEVAPRAVYAPAVDIQSEPIPHAERTAHLTHLHRAEMKRRVTTDVPTVPASAIQPLPEMSLASLPSGAAQKDLPAHFRIFYTPDGKAGSMKMPGFGLKCTKDGVQFKFDEKALALHEKQFKTQFKTLPKNISTFVQLSPEDQATFKELGAIQAGKQHDGDRAWSMQEAESARQIAITNTQAALRSAGVTQVTIDGSDFGN